MYNGNMIYYNAGGTLIMGSSIDDVVGKYRKIFQGDDKGFYQVDNMPDNLKFKLKEFEEKSKLTGQDIKIQKKIDKAYNEWNIREMRKYNTEM